MSLGETLAHQADDASTKEAISIAERILQSNDVSTKAKGTTSANLLFLYLRTGQMEKATTLIRSLPHIWESREILMPEVYNSKAYTEELRECVTKVLSFLCQKIDAVQDRRFGDTPSYIQLGIDFTPVYSTNETLRKIKDFLNTSDA